MLGRAVEEGFAYGWNRAHKHTDKPNQEVIETEVLRAIMNSICEVFDFDEDE